MIINRKDYFFATNAIDTFVNARENFSSFSVFLDVLLLFVFSSQPSKKQKVSVHSRFPCLKILVFMLYFYNKKI